MEVREMTLEDVGTVQRVWIPDLGEVSVRVLMGIKSPKGQILLFSPLPDNIVNTEAQVKAIKEFMEVSK
jgi:hypothetical protein